MRIQRAPATGTSTQEERKMGMPVHSVVHPSTPLAQKKNVNGPGVGFAS